MEEATKPEPEPSSMTVSFLIRLDASIKGGSNAILCGGSTYKFITYAASLKTRSIAAFKVFMSIQELPNPACNSILEDCEFLGKRSKCRVVNMFGIKIL